MKRFTILILAILLSACGTTLTIKTDGEIIYEGPRKISVAKDGDTLILSTSEMLLSQESVQVVTKEAAGVVPE